MPEETRTGRIYEHIYSGLQLEVLEVEGQNKKAYEIVKQGFKNNHSINKRPVGSRLGLNTFICEKSNLANNPKWKVVK